jgi:hypothetical protein
MGCAKWGSRVLDFWRLVNPGPHSPSTTVDGELVRRRGGSAVGVVVTPSARERFTPGELTAAYKVFKERGPHYLDAETRPQCLSAPLWRARASRLRGV